MNLTFAHLVSMSDERGLFEHAEYDKPRKEHGYCVDDVARALIVIERNQTQDPQILELKRIYFQFIKDAQTPDGLFINRCDVNGVWNGVPESADHWGRGLWALGTVYKENADRNIAAEALWRFEHGVRHRGEFLRSMMFAGLGAAAVLSSARNNRAARKLLDDAASMIETTTSSTSTGNANWIWPENRLTYANAIIPEVMIYAGHLLNDPARLNKGLELLNWLLEQESKASHFSVTPTNGVGPNEERKKYDQQPIEIAALVDACSTAYEITGDPAWLLYITRGAHWFDGLNDSNVRMYDPISGAGFDGLTPNSRNENCGAESTVCYLSVKDQYQRHFRSLS